MMHIPSNSHHASEIQVLAIQLETSDLDKMLKLFPVSADHLRMCMHFELILYLGLACAEQMILLE